MFCRSCLEFFAIILQCFLSTAVLAESNSSNVTIVLSSNGKDKGEGFPVWLYAVIPIAVILLIGLIIFIVYYYCKRVQKDDSAYMMWEDSDFELANAYAKESEFLLEKLEQELLDEQQQYEIPMDSIQPQQRVSLGGKRVAPVVNTATEERVEERSAPVPSVIPDIQDPYFVAIVETPTKKKQKKSGRKRSKSQGHKKKRSSGSDKRHSQSNNTVVHENKGGQKLETLQIHPLSEIPTVIKHLSLASLGKGGHYKHGQDLPILTNQPEPQMTKCASVGSNLNKLFHVPTVRTTPAVHLSNVSNMLRTKQFAKSMEAIHSRSYKELVSHDINIEPSSTSKEADPRRVLSADDIKSCADNCSVFDESSVVSSRASVNETRSWSESVSIDNELLSESPHHKGTTSTERDTHPKKDRGEGEKSSSLNSLKEVTIVIGSCDDTTLDNSTEQSANLADDCDTHEEIPYVAINGEHETCSSADCSMEHSSPSGKYFRPLQPFLPTSETSTDSMEFSYTNDFSPHEYFTVNSIGQQLSQSVESSIYAEAPSDFDDGENSELEEFYDVSQRQDGTNASSAPSRLSTTKDDTRASNPATQPNSDHDYIFINKDDYHDNHQHGNDVKGSDSHDHTFDTSEEIDSSSAYSHMEGDQSLQSFVQDSESLLAKISEEGEPIMTSSQDNLHDMNNFLEDSLAVDIAEDGSILEETRSGRS